MHRHAKRAFKLSTKWILFVESAKKHPRKRLRFRRLPQTMKSGDIKNDIRPENETARAHIKNDIDHTISIMI